MSSQIQSSAVERQRPCSRSRDLDADTRGPTDGFPIRRRDAKEWKDKCECKQPGYGSKTGLGCSTPAAKAIEARGLVACCVLCARRLAGEARWTCAVAFLALAITHTYASPDSCHICPRPLFPSAPQPHCAYNHCRFREIESRCGRYLSTNAFDHLLSVPVSCPFASVCPSVCKSIVVSLISGSG
jgi:hypothetical protein